MLNNVWGALDHKDVPEPGYLNFSIVVVEENARLIGLAGGVVIGLTIREGCKLINSKKNKSYKHSDNDLSENISED